MSSEVAPVAALDCGTNSTRLFVCAPDGSALVRLMRITRLGEGVDATGKLSPEAIERTAVALRAMRAEMDRFGVERARLVATSAVRDAANRGEFVRAASEAAGVEVEILEGTEEGRLAYAGARSDLDPGDGDDVVVDIGGGSTELVVATDGVVGAVSLDLGCVRLTERFFHSDPPTRAEVDRAIAGIDAELRRAFEVLPSLSRLRPASRLVGLAGTVSTLAALEQGLSEYDRAKIHHFVLTASAVAQWCAVLASEPASARGERPGMVAGREDVIVGGALVLREVLSALDFAACTVSEADLLDGIAADLLGATAP
jgi:exopolyphosphatase / guanosine-5'-triphosphate,3'-diphosphate pyrophosphatase